MAPRKFVIKCGNFAVLVDLHVLPLGGQGDASWFITDHVEEVTALVRDAVDQRVKQYTESLHNGRQPKQKKELAPASAFMVKGKNFNLVANFLKRHINLRCAVKQLHGDLRVFPERYVVCVSCPEDASAHHGNPSLAVVVMSLKEEYRALFHTYTQRQTWGLYYEAGFAVSKTELSEQSRSEYFSRVGETQEPLKSPTKTKKTALQKIAKQASVMGDGQHICQKNQRGELEAGESELSPRQEALPEADHEVPAPSVLKEAEAHIGNTRKQDLTQKQQTENSPPDSINPNGASIVFCQHEISQETRKSKRCKPSDAGEDPHPQRAKRTCLGRPPATTQTHSTECSTQTSKHDLLPLPPLPPVEAKAESKAFPVSEHKKTTLEVELLTPGKRAQRLPLTSNNTAQTNQNRLAASLRGLSVKPASSGSSISSRSTIGEEGSENAPRTSRLRRLKRS